MGFLFGAWLCTMNFFLSFIVTQSYQVSVISLVSKIEMLSFTEVTELNKARIPSEVCTLYITEKNCYMANVLLCSSMKTA